MRDPHSNVAVNASVLSPYTTELLGWEPKVQLAEGLPKMIEDFRKRMEL